MKICKGQFTREEFNESLEIIEKHSHILGCLSPNQVFNIKDEYGNTPIIESIKHSQTSLAKLFIKLGCDINTENIDNMNCYIWAKWIDSTLIKNILLEPSNHIIIQTNNSIARLNEIKQRSSNDAFALFLDKNSKTSYEIENSGFKIRQNFINSISKQINQVILKLESGLSMYQLKNIFTFDLKDIKTLDNKYNNLILLSKFKTISIIATEQNIYNLSAQEITCILLYTNNDIISIIINDHIKNNIYEKNIKSQFTNTFLSGLSKIDNYVGDVFIAQDAFCNQRQDFSIGSIININGLLNGSTIWRNVTSHLLDFTKKGTVFIVKSKTGKYLGNYAYLKADAEIVFEPFKNFKVIDWYKGNTIALGQSNIRKNTYGIKENEMSQYINTNKSLIIELEEL
jgi:hypothetical protein